MKRSSSKYGRARDRAANLCSFVLVQQRRLGNGNFCGEQSGQRADRRSYLHSLALHPREWRCRRRESPPRLLLTNVGDAAARLRHWRRAARAAAAATCAAVTGATAIVEASRRGRRESGRLTCRQRRRWRRLRDAPQRRLAFERPSVRLKLLAVCRRRRRRWPLERGERRRRRRGVAAVSREACAYDAQLFVVVGRKRGHSHLAKCNRRGRVAARRRCRVRILPLQVTKRCSGKPFCVAVRKQKRRFTCYEQIKISQQKLLQQFAQSSEKMQCRFL